ncbi:MAG TPA: M20/M25/M40 family metallo-hydrolase [Sphingomonadaceae bacterium]|nr:M20/M25/M40 family metallo-hydrolase [Sphingomonadaceae bacterium]
MTIFASALALALAANPLPARDRISEADLAGHISVLASDDYEGRKPGTVASGKTLSYIATAWARAGLRPGAADGSWFQPVALVDRTPGQSDIGWTARGKPVTGADEVLIGAGEGAQRLNGRVTFAGYGLTPPVDVRGKVVLMLAGAPAGRTDVPPVPRRIEAFQKAGAAVVIAVLDAGAPWDRIRAAYGQTQTSRPGPPAAGGGVASAPAFAALATASGRDAAALRTAAAAPGFVPLALDLTLDAMVSTTIRRYTSHNVVGTLPGTGADGEAVAIIGHWDHLGICRPEGAPDRICNGAVDNASGIAVMIEVAERLARGKRSARDIVFVATTAEESGLLGAAAYVDAPTVPLAKIAGVLNIDTIAIGPRGLPVSAVNRGNTAIDPLIDEAARAQGRPLDQDLDANGFINRQDGAVFTRAGVPAVMAGGSFADMKLLQAFLGGAYHGPEDEFTDATPLGGAAEDAELHVLLTRAMADPKRYRRK